MRPGRAYNNDFDYPYRIIKFEFKSNNLSVAEIKKHLYNAIEEIDDEAFLQAVYTIVSSKMENVEYKLTSEQLQILEDRREKYIRGEGKSYTWDEVKDRIRKKDEL